MFFVFASQYSLTYSSKTRLLASRDPSLIPHIGRRSVEEIEREVLSKGNDDDTRGDMFGFRFEWPH